MMMEENLPPEDFYVVGVGASAGGLDALEKFFSHAPADSGLAIIIIQHLSPDYKSLMADLLAKRTDMPVRVAEDGMPVEPNNVYLIPPRQSLTIFHRKLYLTERESGQLYLPIDIFFQSLADDMGERAVGVILSGTGSDGTRGIRAIKENGGLVMVQDEQSAKFDGMPRSAIATKLVDYILPPEQMIREVVNYIQHPCLTSDPVAKRAIVQDEDNLSKIFALLRNSCGVDFTHYKQSTMVRRIERRMGIKQLEKLSDYLHHLYQSPSEVNTLYGEFLIGVTRFFRDPKVFEYIKNEVIPAIFSSKKRGDQIRVWVAGCSTGEEAYSVAILLTEYMEISGRHMDVKVFATDLDKNALESAGKGIYPESIAADVSEEHLKNYFVKSGDSYTVTRRVREMVIFAQQNIITDPPFSKVDLISCRNVLIYLQPTLQKKVISAFQFALNPDGYLTLGTSETVGDMDDYFLCRDTKLKIYQYRGGFRPSLGDSRLTRLPVSLPPAGNRYSSGVREDWRVMDSIQRGLLDAFLPSAAVVDENLNLVYSVGSMNDYLQVPSGWVSTTNILKQAREGLSIPLSTAIHKVLSDQAPITYKNIHFGEGETAQTIDMLAKPFFEQGTRQKLVFIQFNPIHRREAETLESQTYDVAGNAQQRIKDLEHELQYTRESLQATVEELETSNEELQATNEELFAANEELQSTNEELHSVNEELITVNAEYHAKIQELTKLNEDVNNLLSSADVATLFLDLELRVRLFTPSAQKDFHLLAQDIGRPLRFVTHEIIDCDLIAEAEEILRTLAVREREVQNTGGRWYRMRFAPYYTLQQQAGGVVITFMDVTDFKQANEQLAKLSAAVEQSPLSIVITDLKGNIEYVNPRFTQLTGYDAVEAAGKNPRLLKSGLTSDETYRQLWQALANGGEWQGEFINRKKSGEIFYEFASVSPILDEAGKPARYLAIKEDITGRRRAENVMQARLRIMEFAKEHSLAELLQNTLDEFCALTDSPIGFFHYVEPDQRTLSLQAWSTRTLKEMCTAEEQQGRHYDIDQAGVWADCVRQGRPVVHNDYPHLPHRKGLPEGHAPLLREMALPIMRNQKIVAIVGVGNKATDYVDDDVANALHLADLLWDVTERKRAEEALRDSNERFVQFMHHLPGVAYIKDGETRHVFANKNFERFIAADWCGKTNAEIFPETVAATLTQTDQNILAGDKAFQTEEHVQGAYWLSCKFPIQLASTTLLGGVSFDVTDQKRAEEALRKSLEKYHILFESFPHGITVADGDGKILESNREAERILGVSREAHVSRNIDGTEWKIIRPDGLPMPADEYPSVRALKEKRRVEDVELGVVKAKDEVAWINVSAAPLGDYGVVVTYREVDDVGQKSKAVKSKAKKK